jgi:hypothetical protein
VEHNYTTEQTTFSYGSFVLHSVKMFIYFIHFFYFFLVRQNIKIFYIRLIVGKNKCHKYKMTFQLNRMHCKLLVNFSIEASMVYGQFGEKER